VLTHFRFHYGHESNTFYDSMTTTWVTFILRQFAGLTGVGSGSSVAWGDYDNDGDLDILLTGSSSRISKVYRNEGSDTFTDIGAGLVGVNESSVAWGDYDNDGDLDILLTGWTGSARIGRVYRNNGDETFTNIGAELTGVTNSSVDWGDVDNDGDLDILLTGCGGGLCGNYVGRVYRNNGDDTFTNIGAGLTGVTNSSVDWGDYDNDGDLDILLTGYNTGSGRISRIYRNDGNACSIATDDYTTNEDVPLTILPASGVLDNDTGDAVALVADVNNGVLDLQVDGGFIYTPTLNFYGIDSFDYKLNGHSDITTTVTITVNSVNDGVPVAMIDTYTTTQNTPLIVPLNGVLINDVDPDEDATVTLSSDALNGSVLLALDGSFVYTPDIGFLGFDQFRYRITDGDGETDEETVVIEVMVADNSAPIAVSDMYTTAQNTPLIISVPGYQASITWNWLAEEFGVSAADHAYIAKGGLQNITLSTNGVLANDSDSDGDPLTALLVTPVSNGFVALNSDGTFLYVPDSDFSGIDTFTYVADDGSLSDTAVVTITVTNLNILPLATSDVYTTDEDIDLVVVTPGVLLNDNDPNGDPLTAWSDTQPAHGQLALEANGRFIYLPDLNYNGSDSFTYYASDGQSDSITTTVFLNITPVNDPPLALDDSYNTEGTLTVTPTLGLLANDSDPVEGDALTALPDTDPLSGTLILSNDGSFIYTPTVGYSGLVTFTYAVSDGGLTDTAVVTISVDSVNNAPTAVDDAYSVNEDSSDNILDVLSNDSDIDMGDSLSLVAVFVSTNGTAVISGTEVLYTPNANFFGTDVFSYTMSDGALTDTAVVTITVSEINHAPTAVDDSYTVDENNNGHTFDVLANDSDIDGNDLSIVSVSAVANGTAVISGTTILYTPDPDFIGTDAFTYTISDGDLTATASVTVTVTPVNADFIVYLPFVAKP